MANRYWVGGGSSANWNATGNTNWGTASGTQDNASVPTSVDDVIFDGAGTAGNSNSTISATITVKSLTITTGYTSTMTHNAVLTIAGNWTYVNTYTIAGTSGITLSAASTITSNGVTWPNVLTLTNTTTYTLSGNLTVSGLLTVSGTSTVNRTTSEILTTSGGLTTNANISGSAKLILTGGTWSSGVFTNSCSVDLQGNVTISGNIYYGSGTLTYVSGTITTTGSTLNLQLNPTLNTSGIVWNNLTLFTTGTATLTSNISISGLLLVSVTYTINRTTSETVTSSGGMTINSTCQGTAKVILTGGTWSGGLASIVNNLDINGNVTITGNVYYGTGTLTYISGTITTTGSTLNITVSCTLNTNGITWNNLFFYAINTTILTSNLSLSGLLTVSATTTINKTASETVTTSGGITLSSNNLLGTAKVIITGGTWSGSGSFFNDSFDINGNITISGTVAFGTSVLKYISGTVTTTGSTLNITGNSTLNTNGISWNNISSVTGTKTITLTSNLSISGLFTNSQLTTINKTSSETVTLNGGITNNQTLQGTAKLILTGGTWSGTFTINNNLDINGNCTFSGLIYYGTGTFTYITGTVTVTGNTFIIAASCTLNTNGITFNNFTFGFTSTTTLTSNLSLSGLLTVSAATTVNRTTSETVTSAGGISQSANLTGNAELILTGGTWQRITGINKIDMPLTFNGNVSINVNQVYYGGSGYTIKHLSGTITNTQPLYFAGTCSLNLGTTSLSNVGFQANSSTFTLISNLVLTTTLYIYDYTHTINATTNQEIQCAGIYCNNGATTGTCNYRLTGGTISSNDGGFRPISGNNFYYDGNITFGTSMYINCNHTWVSGTLNPSIYTLNITKSVSFDMKGKSFFNIYLATNGGNYTITSPLFVSNLQIDQYVQTINVQDTLTILGRLVISSSTTINNTLNGVVYTNGFLSSANLSGTAFLYWNGGTWTTTSSFSISNPLYINGLCTISGNGYYSGTSLNFITGKINNTIGTLNITANANINGFNKCPLRAVVITGGQTVTMDRFFTGTPQQLCNVSSTGSNYNITFTDAFERMGKYVNVTGCTLARPLQLIIFTNTNRNFGRSNVGIRYVNSSPNSVARNRPPIDGPFNGTAGLMQADPCFQK